MKRRTARLRLVAAAPGPVGVLTGRPDAAAGLAALAHLGEGGRPLDPIGICEGYLAAFEAETPAVSTSASFLYGWVAARAQMASRTRRPGPPRG